MPRTAMDRKSSPGGIRIVAALLLFISLLLSPAFAQTVVEVQPGYYYAGIPSSQFESLAAPDTSGKQRQGNWCWAASIQMILNFHGVDVTQEEIVSRVFGDLIDAPASPDTVLSALSGWAVDSSGQSVLVSASPYVSEVSEIVYDLAYQQPMVIGLITEDGIGHACVLTAISYTVDPYSGQSKLLSVVIRDPWPDRQSRIELSWNEFCSRLMFIARVRVEKIQ